MNSPFTLAVKNTTQMQSSTNWNPMLNPQIQSDISSLLCLILLHHPWFESLFRRQSFAIAFIGSTFSQRLLLGTKRPRILPLDVSLDMSPQI